MKGSKRIIGVSVVVASSLVWATTVNAADKVRVCHLEGDATVGKVLKVSENAVKAHTKHGDPTVFIINKDGSCNEYVGKRPRK